MTHDASSQPTIPDAPGPFTEHKSPRIFKQVTEPVGTTQIETDTGLSPSEEFVNSERVQRFSDRAMAYLDLGYPVHLAGPAGTGKTTLAFHIAAQLGRPVTLLHGNEEQGAGDLVGKDSGYTKSTVVDNYVSSVLKTNEDLSVKWNDNRLTVACEQGHTLIYDEFNRTTPETNNILLSILEEGVLSIPKAGGGYLRVHPEFRLILTSNPEEYAGVHGTPDALLDRLITIDVDHYDADSEAQITSAKSGVDAETAVKIVALCREIRHTAGSGHRPTIRACITLGRVLAKRDLGFDPTDPFFRDVVWDLFSPHAIVRNDDGTPINIESIRSQFYAIVQRIAGSTETATVSITSEAIAERSDEENESPRPRRYRRRAQVATDSPEAPKNAA